MTGLSLMLGAVRVQFRSLARGVRLRVLGCSHCIKGHSDCLRRRGRLNGAIARDLITAYSLSREVRQRLFALRNLFLCRESKHGPYPSAGRSLVSDYHAIGYESVQDLRVVRARALATRARELIQADAAVASRAQKLDYQVSYCALLRLDGTASERGKALARL